MHQGEPPVQFAGRARRDLGDRAAELYFARARARQSLRRRVAEDGRRRQRLPSLTMPDLLLELYSEEIPARMQLQAQENLKKLVTDRLVAAGLVYEGAKAFSTLR